MGDQKLDSMEQEHGVELFQKSIEHQARSAPFADHTHSNIGVGGVEHPTVDPFSSFNASLDAQEDCF